MGRELPGRADHRRRLILTQAGESGRTLGLMEKSSLRFHIIGVFHENVASLDGSESDMGDLVFLIKSLAEKKHVDLVDDLGFGPGRSSSADQDSS